MSRCVGLSLARRVPLRVPCLVLMAGLSGCGDRSGHDPFALMEGQAIYKAECATCHGAQLEGQPGGRTRRADGSLPAPSLGATGTSWHQPRKELAVIVKRGAPPTPAAPGQAVDMPAFGGKLTDAQIDNVLAFVESQWPPAVLQERAERLKGR